MTTFITGRRKWRLARQQITHSGVSTFWSTQWTYGSAQTEISEWICSNHHNIRRVWCLDRCGLPIGCATAIMSYLLGPESLQSYLNDTHRWEDLFDTPRIVVEATFNRNIHITIQAHLERFRGMTSPYTDADVQYKWIFNVRLSICDVVSAVPVLMKLRLEHSHCVTTEVVSLQHRVWNDHGRVWTYRFQTQFNINTNLWSLQPLTSPTICCDVRIYNTELYLYPAEIGQITDMQPDEVEIWKCIERIADERSASKFILMSRELICMPVTKSDLSFSFTRNRSLDIWPQHKWTFRLFSVVVVVYFWFCNTISYFFWSG